MAFSWQQFFDRNGIPYVIGGPNTARDEFGIRCPFCGASDTGEHMAVNPGSKGWVCRRNRGHKGKAPTRLIQALLGCSWDQAQQIAGLDKPAGFGSGDFHSTVRNLLGMGSKEKSKDFKLTFMPEFAKIDGKGVSLRFQKYICGRGYSINDTLKIAALYDLRCAIRGPFAYRVIVPVYMENGLANWTGRAIGDATIRYRTLTTDPEKAEKAGMPVASHAIDKTLWNYAELLQEGGDTLVVLEGPFDAIRIDYYGYEFGLRATCLFGKNLSQDQIILLETLSGKFRRRYVMLDPDASLDSFAMWTRLEYLGFRFIRTPSYVEDAAEMRRSEIIEHFHLKG